jgi:hypothetical protein
VSRGIDFIFATVLLDMLGLGIIIAPVLPKFVLTLTGGDGVHARRDLSQAGLDASLTQMNTFTEVVAWLKHLAT